MNIEHRSAAFFGWILALGMAAALPGAEPAPASPPKAPDPDRIGPPPIEAPTPAAGQPSPSTPQVPRPTGLVPPRPVQPTPLAAVAGKKPHFEPFIPSKDYQPPIILIPEPKYDFGKVYKGEVVTKRFEIENRGGASLMIQKVRPSCGCTLVNETTMDKVIPPGGKGGFELKIETSRLGVGKQSKYADVSSNDPKNPQARVTIQGEIEAMLKVDPENPRIQTVRGTGEAKTDITLRCTQPEMKVLNARSQSGRLVLELKETQPSSAYALGVKTNYGPKDTQSYFTEIIQVDIQVGERRMTQDINLAVQVKDRIDTNPRMVYFRKNDFQTLKDKGTPAVKTVDLKAALDEPYAFKITETKLDTTDAFFTVKVEPVKDGREYRLVVSVDKMPDLSKDPNQKSLKGNITVLTNDPQMPEIAIRCVAFF